MGESAEQEALIQAVTEKTNRWLTEIAGSYLVDSDGDSSIRNGSTRVFIRVVPWMEDAVLVRMISILVRDVPQTDELLEWVAFHCADQPFGTVCLAQSSEDSGLVQVHFGHTLLGDYMDMDEFGQALVGMAVVGDSLDSELQARFGGELFHDDSEDE